MIDKTCFLMYYDNKNKGGKQMDNKFFDKAVSNATENIIKREVDCFTDEIIRAERIFHIIDKYDSTEAINEFMSNFKSTDIKDSYESFDFTKLSDDDLLIAVTKDGTNEVLIQLAKKFKENGGRVVSLIENRNSKLTKYSQEILGININNSDAEKIKSSKDVFKEVSSNLLKHIEVKAKKIISMADKDISHV